MGEMYTDFQFWEENVGHLERIETLLEQLVKLERKNNLLCMKTMQGLVNYKELPDSIPLLPESHVLIVAPSEKEALSLIEKCYGAQGKKLHNYMSEIRNGGSVRNVLPSINGLVEYEHIFINCDDIFEDPDYEGLLEAILYRRPIKLRIGSGPATQLISLDIPPVNAILYTSLPSLIPPKLTEMVQIKYGI